MAAENCQWRCHREPQILFRSCRDCVKSDKRREVDRIKRVKLQDGGAGAGGRAQEYRAGGLKVMQTAKIRHLLNGVFYNY